MTDDSPRQTRSSVPMSDETPARATEHLPALQDAAMPVHPAPVADATPAPAASAAVPQAASAAAPDMPPAPYVRKHGVPQADNWRALRSICAHYLGSAALARIDEAYDFASAAHKDQRRQSGEPYINHPVEVAFILAKDLHMDEDSICSAILHDTVEDTSATLDDIEERFGYTVRELSLIHI